MAEEKAAPQAEPAAAAPAAKQKPTLFIILAIVNMLVVVGVGAMIWMGEKKKAHEPNIDDVVHGEDHHQKEEAENK